jgi:UDP-N-acetylglucosamine--N-acetylmuramyl-(pentapeptide) pyrophosphoryl-undecaprenol N-acetylglucosamine transferase
MNKLDKKVILLVGGGTGGSVSPLLAITEELNNSDYEFIFVGGKDGPEKKMLAETSIEFYSISAGKLRRYFSWKNFSDLYFISKGFFESRSLLRKIKPSLVISTGSFVAVPLILAAKTLGIKIWVHQQDVIAGLANKLTAPLANLVTVTFEKSLNSFNSRALWVGNFARKQALEKKPIIKKNTVLFIGGGTGAIFINNLAIKLAKEKLDDIDLVLVSGSGKKVASSNLTVYEFLSPSEFLDLMASSSLIISRCGLGALTEIAALKKPVILIPMPDSHQEANAEAVSDMAWQVLGQKDFSWLSFVEIIEDFFANNKRKSSSQLIKLANKDIPKLLNKIYEKR